MKQTLITIGFQALLDVIAAFMAKYAQPQPAVPVLPGTANLPHLDIETGTFVKTNAPTA